MRSRTILIGKYRLTNIILLFTVSLFSLCLTVLGISDRIPYGMSFLWTVMLFVFLGFIMRSYCSDSVSSNIVFFAFIVRLFFLFIDIIGNDFFGKLLNVRDYSVFESIASQYYRGIFSNRSSNYPYVINMMYHIFGDNVFIVRAINVFLSTWAVAMAGDVLTLFNVSQKTKMIALFIPAFSPYSIFYSILLMRESIYFLFLTASFCNFAKWYKFKKDVYMYSALGFTLPAIYLHSGYLTFSGVYLFFFLFDKSKKTKSKIPVILFRVFLAVLILFVLSQFQSLHYLTRNSGRGLIYTIQKTYRQHLNQGGGSQYLKWMGVTYNPLLILLYTPIRAFFFLSSPFLLDWRGLNDIISFSFDSIIHLYVISNVLSFLKKKRDERAAEDPIEVFICKWGMMIIFLTSLVFCWGVTTSGAAIRHRNCLFGLESVLFALSCNKNKQDDHDIEVQVE